MTKRSTTWKRQHQEWAILVALSLLVALLRLPSLEQPFDNDSGAIAYHARLIIRGEPLYSTHHPAHHMPAAYYTYALAFLLFGDSVWAVKFLLVLWTIVTVCLLYHMATLLLDRPTGLLAALFYTILSSHIWLFGSTAEIELFANLPRLAASLLAIHLATRNTAAWKFALVGLLSAAAFYFKAVYLSPLAIASFVFLVELWRARKTAEAWRTAIMRSLWTGVGFALGLSLVTIYFAALGLLPRFLLVFVLGQTYVTFNDLAPLAYKYWPLFPFIGLMRNNAVLLICSLGGIATATLGELQKRKLARDGKVSPAFYVSVWYVLSLVESNVNRSLFLHYYLLILPPLVLLAAWFLVKLYDHLREHPQISQRVVAISIPTALVIAALIASVIQNLDYYRLYARYKLRIGSYDDFLLHGWAAIGPELVQVQKLAAYIQDHTLSSDRVYYWSTSAQLYYLADRRCPIDMIWPRYIEATGSHQRIFAPQTKYIIVGDSYVVPRPDWLYPELAENGYELETIIEDQEIYRRTD